MTIQVPPGELFALAAALRSCGDTATQVAAHLPDAAVGGPVQPALLSVTGALSVAGRYLAEELRWLGDTVAAVADDWAGLDGSLLAAPGEVTAR